MISDNQEWITKIAWDTKRSINRNLDFVDDLAIAGLYVPIKMQKENKSWVEYRRQLFNINDGKLRILDEDDPRFSSYIIEDTITEVKNPYHFAADIDFLRQTIADDSPADLFNVALVYAKMVARSRHYLDFRSDPIHELVSLYTIGTHLYPLFYSYPFLFLNGIRQVGKTKAGDFIRLLAFNGIRSPDLTGPCLFRVPDTLRATLILDETEEAIDRRSMRYRAIISTLLDSNKAGGTAIRVEGEHRFGLAFYRTYCPKVICNIGGALPTLNDRSITLIMMRTLDKQIADAQIDEHDPEWRRLRTNLTLIALRHWRTVMEIYERLAMNQTSIHARAYEKWRPILALAEWVGGQELNDKMIALALEIDPDEPPQPEEEIDTALLLAMHEHVAADFKGWISVKEMLEWLTIEKVEVITDSAGHEHENKIRNRDYDWLKTEHIGRALRRLDIKKKRRLAKTTEYWIERKGVDELCRRYTITNQTKLDVSGNGEGSK